MNLHFLMRTNILRSTRRLFATLPPKQPHRASGDIYQPSSWWKIPATCASTGVTLFGIYYLTAPPDSFLQVARGGNQPSHINTNAPTVGLRASKNNHHAPDQDQAEVSAGSAVQNEHQHSDTVETEQDNVVEQIKETHDNTEPVLVAKEQDVKVSDAPKALETSMITQYVLVGGGPAAYTAMKAIYEREPNADVLIITDEKHPPYMRPPLSKELWFSDEKSAAATSLKFNDWSGQQRDLFFEPVDHYHVVSEDHAGVIVPKPKILLNTRVEQLNVTGHTLTLTSGRSIRYGKCLLATGGRPKIPASLESVKSDVWTFRNVQKIVSCFVMLKVNDFRKLMTDTPDNARIAVVGGGFLGSELAIALATFGKEHNWTISQVIPESGNMALVFPTYLTKWTTEKMKKGGVNVISDTTVKSASKPSEKEVLLHLSNESDLTADIVIVAAGIDPKTSLIVDNGLEEDENRGGVVVTKELEAARDVYVAGDLASYFDAKLGRRRVEHHDHAIVSGRFAGLNMTGARKVYDYQPMFWSDLGPEIGYEAVGVVDSSLDTIGIWAKATLQDTPKKQSGFESGPTPPVEMPTKHESESVETELPSNTTDEFGKGIVLYTRDGQVVGVVLWNLFNRTSVARRAVSEGWKVTEDDIAEMGRRFRVFE